ncbi:MgtC/SapB family protein [Legionella quateirensis]|uniref:Protein MgtC n=1 Tax=Legionella quateirensis TaxID=45072 RepID=A0A378KS23_9GAMM|nr:MgtC/SapB family protein [Legionella quateirensis]KTD43637.1 putative Mg(2+) transport ATPase [Legionella quateirensis]STY17375.1 putative Mg(2+) transport ATPase [Legionella quateirensis]
MALINFDTLFTYWSLPAIEINIIVFMNLLGSLILGLIVGYERSYHGRAAGMRTYGLVCMASTALVVIVGYPNHWFGGSPASVMLVPDVTRVVQGIVTGIGFLGAGVIMKEGFSISGLTTAASIWTASAIGILVGVGFYFSAILLTFLSLSIMMWGFRLENWLPSRHSIAVSLTFKSGVIPNTDTIRLMLKECDYSMAQDTIAITSVKDAMEWRFVGVASTKKTCCTIPELSQALRKLEGIDSYYVAFARN